MAIIERRETIEKVRANAKPQKKTEVQLCMEDTLRRLFDAYHAETEYQFHPTRKWRWDYCVPHLMLAIEIDGAVFTNGRHTRGLGVESDCIKFAEGVILGWRVFRFTTRQATNGVAEDLLRRWRDRR